MDMIKPSTGFPKFFGFEKIEGVLVQVGDGGGGGGGLLPLRGDGTALCDGC